jgi:RNA polymerase sigma factor (sigma-70 family)
LRIPHNTKTYNAPTPTVFEAQPMAHESVNELPPLPPRRELDEEIFVRIYEKHFSLLVAVAIRKFQIPPDDAEALAHEVFLSYLKRKDEIRDLQKWLLGAICNASRYYWRQHGRNIEQLDVELAAERPDPASTNILDLMMAKIAAGEALAGLPPRWQHILRLRYFEGYSINEIAEHLGVTAKYTQKLVTKCLRRAEEIFNALEKPRTKK